MATAFASWIPCAMAYGWRVGELRAAMNFLPYRERFTGMITLLSNIFRGLSFVFGITAPPPNQDQRQFVHMWLGIIGFLISVFVGLFYFIWHLHPAYGWRG